MKKYILFFFAAITAATATAQSDGRTDTSYIQQVGRIFFTVTRVDFPNGTYRESRDIIGDSMALFSQYRNTTEQQAKDMATEVSFISGYARRITGLIRDGERIRTLTGRNPVDSLRLDSATRAHYTGRTWLIRGDTAQNISFNYTAAGALRYRINNGANQPAIPIGRAIVRLRHYPSSGRDTDFYLVAPNRYIVTSGRLRIITQTTR